MNKAKKRTKPVRKEAKKRMRKVTEVTVLNQWEELRYEVEDLCEIVNSVMCELDVKPRDKTSPANLANKLDDEMENFANNLHTLLEKELNNAHEAAKRRLCE